MNSCIEVAHYGYPFQTLYYETMQAEETESFESLKLSPRAEHHSTPIMKSGLLRSTEAQRPPTCLCFFLLPPHK